LDVCALPASGPGEDASADHLFHAEAPRIRDWISRQCAASGPRNHALIVAAAVGPQPAADDGSAWLPGKSMLAQRLAMGCWPVARRNPKRWTFAAIASVSGLGFSTRQ
jgi:hypothetical protein